MKPDHLLWFLSLMWPVCVVLVVHRVCGVSVCVSVYVCLSVCVCVCVCLCLSVCLSVYWNFLSYETCECSTGSRLCLECVCLESIGEFPVGLNNINHDQLIMIFEGFGRIWYGGLNSEMVRPLIGYVADEISI